MKTIISGMPIGRWLVRGAVLWIVALGAAVGDWISRRTSVWHPAAASVKARSPW